MNIESFISGWLEAANAFDTTKFLDKWHKDAILEDPSVGETFEGHAGIRKYFEDYFIDYKTQTRVIKLDMVAKNKANITVEFTGDFPGKKIAGTFNFIFKDEKINKAKADLI